MRRRQADAARYIAYLQVFGEKTAKQKITASKNTYTNWIKLFDSDEKLREEVEEAKKTIGVDRIQAEVEEHIYFLIDGSRKTVEQIISESDTEMIKARAEALKAIATMSKQMGDLSISKTVLAE